MPFYGLEGNFDHFGCPWALAHETLHTFGYGHGDRMSRATKMVQDRLKLFRWYVADHPGQDLDTAFAGFRLALRNSHPEAIASHAQGERKGR